MGYSTESGKEPTSRIKNKKIAETLSFEKKKRFSLFFFGNGDCRDLTNRVESITLYFLLKAIGFLFSSAGCFLAIFISMFLSALGVPLCIHREFVVGQMPQSHSQSVFFPKNLGPSRRLGFYFYLFRFQLVTIPLRLGLPEGGAVDMPRTIPRIVRFAPVSRPSDKSLGERWESFRFWPSYDFLSIFVLCFPLHFFFLLSLSYLYENFPTQPTMPYPPISGSDCGSVTSTSHSSSTILFILFFVLFFYPLCQMSTCCAGTATGTGHVQWQKNPASVRLSSRTKTRKGRKIKSNARIAEEK